MGLFSKKPRLEKIDIERLLKHGFIATGNKYILCAAVSCR